MGKTFLIVLAVCAVLLFAYMFYASVRVETAAPNAPTGVSSPEATPRPVE